MSDRLRALLVHGMGNDASWWDPVSTDLADLGVTPVALALPPLDGRGPDAWLEAVLRAQTPDPTVLVGHSLGAAVALAAARSGPFEGVVLLACPPAFAGGLPRVPEGRSYSVTVLASVAQFLRRSFEEPAPPGSVHFAGDQDPYVPLDQAARPDIPLIPVVGAGHELAGSALFRDLFCRYLAGSPVGARWLDPALRVTRCPGSFAPPAESVELFDAAAPPARLDVEVTTRCQLACARCARTLRRSGDPGSDMGLEVFERVLDDARWAGELILVGLGEPLLHPGLGRLVAAAARRGLAPKLVTNGLAAAPTRLAILADVGLSEVTFSIDAVDPGLFARLRGGAPLGVVLSNLRTVPPGLRKSIFATLSGANAGELPGLVDLAADEGLPALVVSDVNFEENQADGLHAGTFDRALAEGLLYARRRGVLILTQRFHDAGDARLHYRRCVARLPADVTDRSSRHRNCLAPWRIAVVGVDGTLTPCNCAPDYSVGNVATEGLSAAWNGQPLQAWRRAVRSGSSRACHGCPRY